MRTFFLDFKKRTGSLLVLILGLLAIFIWVQVASAGDNNLHIKFYDVGQGDSIFIRTPGGYNILIDGGPNNKVVEYLNQDLKMNDRVIDLVILTHPQADHMFGLIETVKRYKVKKVISSGVSNSTDQYRLWIDTLSNRGLKVETVKAGESIKLPDSVRISFLWPKEERPQVADLNEASVVFKISYGEFDVLLTGDADSKVQPYTSITSPVEVFKIPHHGSKTALKEDFLNLLSPDAVVFSVGAKNRYGHPGANVIELAKKVGAKIFRTDKNGTVEFVSEGKRWYTRTER